MEAAGQSATRRRTWVLLGVTVAAGAALAVLLTVPRSAGSAAARSAIPSSAISRLTATALKIARFNGDKAPTSIEAVETTRARALRTATPGDTVPQGAQRQVYLVVMTGKFTAYGASPPAGAALPTGSYLSVTLDPRTFRGMDFGLSDHAPPVSLASLGPVTMLTK